MTEKKFLKRKNDIECQSTVIPKRNFLSLFVFYHNPKNFRTADIVTYSNAFAHKRCEYYDRYNLRKITKKIEKYFLKLFSSNKNIIKLTYSREFVIHHIILLFSRPH